MEFEDIEFDWEIIEVVNTSRERGAMVKYTPVGEFADCAECTMFVPIPWQKCRDEKHMGELAALKINARAPCNRWLKEATPPQPDISEKLLKGMKNERFKGGQRRKPGGDNDTGRSESGANVSE